MPDRSRYHPRHVAKAARIRTGRLLRRPGRAWRRATLKRSERAFLLRWFEAGCWGRISWMGTRLAKHPFDLIVMQEIIHEVRPEVILEAGTFNGGSALYYAHLLDLLDIDGQVVTVDVEEQPDLPDHPKIRYLSGSSVAPDVLEEMALAADGKRTMVFLDSLHTRDHVLAEMRAYGPLVTPGSYMIVEDGVAGGHPVEPEHGPGPTEALDIFLAETTTFEVDREREKLVSTFNPRGYLRRVTAPSP